MIRVKIHLVDFLQKGSRGGGGRGGVAGMGEQLFVTSSCISVH